MNFKDLRDEVIDCLDCGVSVELISAPGRGKSEFVEDLVEYLSRRDGFQWGFTTLFLATYTPSDLMGYMVPQKIGDMLAAQFTTPAWMITREGKHINEYKRAIVFLDEYGQGEGDVKRASAQLLLKGEVGPHRLKPGIGVIAASNRASDRSGVTKSFDFVINRRGQFEITDDIRAWVEWAMTHDVYPTTIAFAEQNPQIVFSDGVPEKQGPWCTPRSLVMVDRLLKRKAERLGGEDKIPDKGPIVETVSGLIGAGAAAQYFAFVRLSREMPSYEEIKKNPKGAKVPEKPDAQMLVCYNLAYRVSAEDAEPVVAYVERMPKEFAVTFAVAACRRVPALVATPAFNKWAMENSSLMAAISR